MKHSRPFRALVFVIVVHALLSGCATSRDQDDGPVFYPPPPQRPRIQFLASISGAKDVEEATSPLMKFLVGDMKSRRNFRKPTAVASHEGAIYVADPGWDSVIVADLRNQVFDTLRDRGTGKLQVPVAIAIDADGNKFVADTGRNQVVQFNERNEFVRAFGNPEVLRPTGVAVDERFVYVVNRKEHRVEVFDRFSKERVRSFGMFGAEDGQFNIPTSITRDEKGHLFVTDATNFRIQEFDSEGTFVKSFGFLGDGPGTFARPRGLAVSRGEHLYTVDGAFENVQIWDAENAQVLLAFGGAGVGPGQMYLPASVYIDYGLREHFADLVDPDFELEYLILVVNNYGPNKLAVYGFIHPKDPSRYPEYALPDRGSEG